MLTINFYDRLFPNAAYASAPQLQKTEFNIAGDWCIENYSNNTAERYEGKGRAFIRQDGVRLRINGTVEDKGEDGRYSLPATWTAVLGEVNGDGRIVFFFKIATRADQGISFGYLTAYRPDHFSLRFYDLSYSSGQNIGTTIFRRLDKNVECS